MSKEITGRFCPLCKREYSGEDNYCGDDGSPLEALEPGDDGA